MATAGESPAYSEALREQARRNAERIRERLQAGDFRVGDRVLITVEQQQALSDTFVVSAGPALVLPGVGSVALGGVLSDELQPSVRGAVQRVFRGAVVRAQRLVRVSVERGVGRPGFYDVSGESRLDDVIQIAGGPGRDGRLERITVERGRERIIGGDSVLAIVRDARTLDDLSMRDGDRIIVGERRQAGEVERSIRAVSLLLGLPLTILSLTQIFQ